LNWQVQAPWLEALVNHGGASLDTLNGAGGGEEDELKALGGGRRRVFKTHAPFGLMPCVDLAGSGAKVIYVARNPKDACVSAFYHNRAIPMHEYDGPWDNFCGLYLEVSGDSFPCDCLACPLPPFDACPCSLEIAAAAAAAAAAALLLLRRRCCCWRWRLFFGMCVAGPAGARVVV
jgi:hypothetical protein